MSDVFFMAGNLLLWISFTTVLFSLAYKLAAMVALVLLAFALVTSATGMLRREV
jgi:hypothetical protein